MVDDPSGLLECIEVLANNIILKCDMVPIPCSRPDLAESGDLQLPVKYIRKQELVTAPLVSSLAIAGRWSYSCDFELDPDYN